MGTYDWRQSPMVKPPGPVAPNAKKTASAPRAASLSGWRAPTNKLAQKPTPRPVAKTTKSAVKKSGTSTPWKPSTSGNVGKYNPNPKPYPYGPNGNSTLPTVPGGGNVPDGMTLDQYLGGDTTYQDQVSLFQKIMEDFMLSNTGQRGDVEEDFATALERLGLQSKRDKHDMTGDFASRGLLNSGLFTGEMSEYDTDYQNTISDLSTDKNRAIEDLLESLGMFQTQLDAQKIAARQEAVRRYAERFASLPDGAPASNPDVNPVATPPNQKPMGPSSGRKPATPTKKTAKKAPAKKATAAKKATGPFGAKKFAPAKKTTTAAQRRLRK